MAIGLFGGSFDPVHHGHLIAGDRAAEVLGLERVLLVPCARQPLKPDAPVGSARQRTEMLGLAVRDHGRFEVETCELDRAPPSYTVDTLRHVRELWPSERLVLIVGTDAAAGFARWRAMDEVASLAEVAVLTRPGSPEVSSPFVRHMVATPAIEISSSDIRARCLTGKSVRYLVPEAVAEYIERERLYR